MRFQKSIKICKGVRLNVSKSGVSATVGVKGISLNLGKKGVFLNTSLPGTGLSDRRKLFGGKKQTKKVQPEPLNPRDYELRAEDGEIRVLNAAGRSVSEEEARRVRRTDWFKDAQAQLNAETIDRVNAETEAVETIHHAAKRVPACGNIESEARVESRFDAFLNQLDLPVEFSAQYQYDETNGNILIDLDLPEIEDLPQEKAAALASGAVRVKPKTLAEKRETYQKCVFGIAILFADGAFLSSAGIRNALVSGYTQRRNVRTGEMEDQYVFSIAFNRAAFANVSFERTDPAAFVQAFRNRMNPAATGELKTIQPYTAEEFSAMTEDGA